MKTLAKVLLWLAGGVTALLALGWIGLQVPARRWMPAVESVDLGPVAQVEGLPRPVQRYLDTVGARIPRTDTAQVWGRARANFNGIWFPLRWNASYVAGEAFVRNMELTWFGIPFMRAQDLFHHGVAQVAVGSPVNQVSGGPKTAKSAMLSLLGEGVWMPGVFTSMPGLRWEAVDDTHARLHVSSPDTGGEEETLEFTFDATTGLPVTALAQRYRTEEGERVPWQVDMGGWEMIEGVLMPAVVSVTWLDDGQAWSHWKVEAVRYNVDVQGELAAKLAVTK